jgi:hypothetical protein
MEFAKYIKRATVLFLIIVALVSYGIYDVHNRHPEDPWHKFWLPRTYDPRKVPGTLQFPWRRDDREAPLHACDSPDRIPDNYCVYLRYGYPLETHKLFVANFVDLDTTIDQISPQTDRHGTFYWAVLNETGLVAVRDDLGVDMVVCDQYVRPAGTASSQKYKDHHEVEQELRDVVDDHVDEG